MRQLLRIMLLGFSEEHMVDGGEGGGGAEYANAQECGICPRLSCALNPP